MNKYKFTLFTVFSLCSSADSDSGSCISVDLKQKEKQEAVVVPPSIVVTPAVIRRENSPSPNTAEVPAVQDRQRGQIRSPTMLTRPIVTATTDSPTFNATVNTAPKLPQPQPVAQPMVNCRSKSVPVARPPVVPVVQIQPTLDDAQVSYSCLGGNRVYLVAQPMSIPISSPVDGVRVECLTPMTASPVAISSSLGSPVIVQQGQCQESPGGTVVVNTPATFPIGTPEPSSHSHEEEVAETNPPTKCLRCKKNTGP